MRHESYIEAENYYDMARSWIGNGDNQKAMDCLKHALSLNPDFIYAYIDMAEIFAREDNYCEAQRVIKNAIYHDMKFHNLHYLMAKYAYREKNFGKALQFINSAINISPEYLYERVKRVIQRRYDQEHCLK